MLISEFQYDLPQNLIAQEPLPDRENSRMLVIDRSSKSFKDAAFLNFPDFLREGDVVVVNNTRVFPARLLGKSETDANIEIFLVEEIEDKVWLTLARPARRLKSGKIVLFGDRLKAEVLEKTADGKVIIRFETTGDFDDILQEVGKTPLPPYIKREETTIDTDRERYQTIYATNRGAIAAPTAGLHFTPDIIGKIQKAGASLTEITLHVGYGTFEPVRVSELSEHSVSPERYEIGDAAADTLNTGRNEGRRIIAIGTTTTRALETAISRDGKFVAGKNSADLTITPGYKFRAVDCLLTNFHLPQSSLLVLVSTFGGHELIMKAYQHAVASQYRFYSYGDCMLVL